jgi:hypothetical protein
VSEISETRKPGKFAGEEHNVAFALSRVAHYMLERGGYTKKQAAAEIASVARALSPELAARVLGNAASPIEEQFASAQRALEATGIAGIMDEFRDLPDAITQMAAHIATLTEQRDRAEGRKPYAIRPSGEIVEAEDF